MFITDSMLSRHPSGLVPCPDEGTERRDRWPAEEFPWRPIGPAQHGRARRRCRGGRANPSIIYVGAATSGVWKTDNNGTTWMPVFDGQPNLSIGDIAIAPSNPNIVWVGTGEANQRQSTSYGGGVFKSIDAGKTWSAHGPARQRHDRPHRHRSRETPDVVYVAAAGDLFKAHPSAGSTKRSTAARRGRNRSSSTRTPDSSTWRWIRRTARSLIAASYQRRRTAWGFNGGGPGSALWKTIDAGKTWKRIEGGGLPAYGHWGRVGLAFSRSNPNVVYAMIEPGPQAGGGGGGEGGGALRIAAELDPNRAGIWRSDDKGATWKLTSNDNGRAMYFSQIRVDPKDPEHRLFALERTSTSPPTAAGRSSRFPSGARERMPDPADAVVARRAVRPRPGRRCCRRAIPIITRCGSTRPTRSTSSSATTAAWISRTTAGAPGSSQNWMPMGQFYQVAVDMRQPYWVYGGAQDNGVWGGPSRVRNNGGITKEHWFELAAGDGFPRRRRSHRSGHRLHVGVRQWRRAASWRHNLRTGEQKYIRPTPPRRGDDRRTPTAFPPPATSSRRSSQRSDALQLESRLRHVAARSARRSTSAPTACSSRTTAATLDGDQGSDEGAQSRHASDHGRHRHRSR